MDMSFLLCIFISFVSTKQDLGKKAIFNITFWYKKEVTFKPKPIKGHVNCLSVILRGASYMAYRPFSHDRLVCLSDRLYGYVSLDDLSGKGASRPDPCPVLGRSARSAQSPPHALSCSHPLTWGRGPGASPNPACQTLNPVIALDHWPWT